MGLGNRSGDSWVIMKLLCILLLGNLLLGQVHHDFKNYLEDRGYVDKWSLYHAGAGGVKTCLNSGFWWLNEKYNWMDEPSAFKQVGGNLVLALAWEYYEYLDHGGTLGEYNDTYGGKALQNNGFDVFLDMVVFCIPHYKGMYYELAIIKHGFSCRAVWLL